MTRSDPIINLLKFLTDVTLMVVTQEVADETHKLFGSEGTFINATQVRDAAYKST